MKSPRKPPGLRQMFAAGAAVLSLGAAVITPAPAHAQFGFGGIVYDPSNYAQNVLTAARTLEQINNQIRMLQNQATQLINEARNLEALPLTVIEPLQQQIRQTQQLLSKAQGIAYDVQAIEREFARNYSPASLTGSQRDMVRDAKSAGAPASGPSRMRAKYRPEPCRTSKVPAPPCRAWSLPASRPLARFRQHKPETSCSRCSRNSSPISSRRWRQ